MKVCKCCGVEKPLDAFTYNGKWRINKCKPCKNAEITARRLRDPLVRERKRLRDQAYNLKNRAKLREIHKAWANKNKDKMAMYAKRYKDKNREDINEKHRIYTLVNAEKIKIRMKIFRQNNKAKCAEYVRRRQAAKVNRTPKWLNEDHFWMMQQAYELAALRTKVFGFSWHVDHIIPLRGKTVSGLHVPWNLQVIPGIDNMKKANKHT